MRLTIRHIYEHQHSYDPQLETLLRSINQQLGLILQNQETLMATKEQVAADLVEIKNEVAETKGAANSAIVLLNEVLAKVDTAAATATDLDGFRADLALIKDGLATTEADLKAAVVQNPAPPA